MLAAFSESPALACDLWTWKEFNCKVDELCPLESRRIFSQMNPDGSSVFYRRTIRQAVIDLRHLIPEFTKNNETIYFPGDFTEDGMASVGALPPNSQVTDMWYYCTKRKRRYPVHTITWEKRFEMTTRELWDSLNLDREFGEFIGATSASLDAAHTLYLLGRGQRKQSGMVAISPQHERFYLHPKVRGSMVFSIFWDGQKLDDRDNELVPFDEETAGAVADWVKAEFAGYIERDLQRAQGFKMEYAAKRSNIFIRMQAKGFLST